MVNTQIIKDNFPLFSDPDLLASIAQVGEILEFEEGEIIIDIGMPIPFVPLLISGSMRIVRRDDNDSEILLYYLEEGQSCASSLTCCMNSQVSEVEAIAEEDVKLIAIPAKYIDHWISEFPEWKSFIMNTYRNRFDELLNTVNSIAFNQLDERLIKYLKERTHIHKDPVLKTSHQEIAQNLNTSREVVSRLLKQLEKNGMVKLSRNKIELLEN